MAPAAASSGGGQDSTRDSVFGPMGSCSDRGSVPHNGTSLSGRKRRQNHDNSDDSASSISSNMREEASCVPCLSFLSTRQRRTNALNLATPDSHAAATTSKAPSRLTDGDVLQATDLINLSLEERTKAEEDVHGVSHRPISKDPNFHQESLQALDTKLRKIREKKAYDLAAFLYPSYTKDPEFRLIFLRIADFNVDLAARRLVLFFKKKLELFGKKMLGRRVSLRDMGDDVVEAFELGCFQLFPRNVRDQSGRPVYFHMSSAYGQTNKLSLLKSFFYTMLAGIQEMSVDDHQRGSVIVIHFLGVEDTPQEFLDFIMRGMDVVRSLPLKAASLHICSDNPAFQNAVSLVQLSVTQRARVRLRLHFGSYLEIVYALQSFGISASIFPMEIESHVDQERFQLYLQQRKQREEAEWTNTELSPQDNDVLLGRGKPYQSHSGNVQFGNLIDRYRQEYMATVDKDARLSLVLNILRIVREDMGGRFLKLNASGKFWQVATEEEARRKARHVLRPKV